MPAGEAADDFADDGFAPGDFAGDALDAEGAGFDRLAGARLAADAAAGAGLAGAGFTADAALLACATVERPMRAGLSADEGGVARPAAAPGRFVETAATGCFALPAPLAVAMVPLPLKRPSGAAEMLVRLVSFCTAQAFCQTPIARAIGAVSRSPSRAWRNLRAPPYFPLSPRIGLPNAMYIVAIAWLYVLMLVSIMQPTVFRGVVTFLGAGLLPLALLLYLMGTPQRRRVRALAEQTEPPAQSPEPDVVTPPSDGSR